MLFKIVFILAVIFVQQAFTSTDAHAAIHQAYAVLDGKGFVSIVIGIYAKLAATGRIPFIAVGSNASASWRRRAITSLQLIAPGLILLGLVMLVGN